MVKKKEYNLYLFQISTSFTGTEFYYIPYSVGSIWAHCKSVPTIDEHFTLKDIFFKREDIDTVVAKIKNPSIVAFSMYLWNENYSLETAKRIKEKYPKCLIVVGGPSVPDNSKNFLKRYPWIDLAVHNEGEVTFSEILLEFLKDSPTFELCNVSWLTDKYFKGGFKRINNLEGIVSPYTSGVFDDMIKRNPDIKFNISLETNRGCPFSCTFCDWGSLTQSKVKRFKLDRVFDELEWTAKNKVEFITLADANFGIFLERDNLIVDKMIDLKQKTGYPQIMSTSWNKNMKIETVEIAKKLIDSGLFRRFTASIQTINQESLVAIKRKNLDGTNFENIIITAKDAGLPVSTELIIGLPLETYESYLDLLEYVITNDLPYIYSHLQILKNSEMAKKSYIEKYELDILRSESSFSDEYAKEYELSLIHI